MNAKSGTRGDRSGTDRSPGQCNTAGSTGGRYEIVREMAAERAASNGRVLHIIGIAGQLVATTRRLRL